MARIMSIDYGDARVGIALTDPLQIIASGFKTIPNNIELYREIYDIYVEKEVESIVIGVPYAERSEIGFAAKKVVNFTLNLFDFFKKNGIDPIFFEMDERYSTSSAQSSMKEIKVKNKRKKEIVDQIAAANILKDYLSQKKKYLIDIEKFRKINEERLK
ncbi:MAG TPA: Holliday junction resolvase RuvX [Spirochaetota bacterium]|nr:Holliday junction resolvase RuvX [Spirochaetota bacterium]HOS32239.1 Holliday junction resolvase RuvX [Spirochaetota bacterium]HOS55107.1 Holliday junction resolvase RuvX [Spirochaetota bacterium]HPK62133.1 Holliday junction resolvase RuvX [Spirochaetota bacterium]HQF77614.1 Holliday junction resolvase RuvX [Spirochaetota bacterium]